MTKPFSRKLAQAHIVGLAREHGIAIRWVKGRGWHYLCEAYRRPPLVRIARPYNAAQYLVALHELGHVLGPFQSRADFPHVSTAEFHFLSEAGADIWAAEHIHDDLDQSISKKVVAAVVGEGLAGHWWHVAVHAREG